MKAWLETRRVFVLMLALGLFAMAARGMTDPDAWWHLRTGQLITASHSIPHADPFSYTRAGQPWVAHEWLSDVLLYNLYRLGGWGGLILSSAIAATITMMLLFFRCAGRPYVAGAVTTWAALASIPCWGVRPIMISLLLASIFLLILEHSSAHPAGLWGIPPLTLLWVNLHAEFALGMALVFFFLVGSWLDFLFELESRDKALPRLRRLAVVLAVSLALVPLNPNGGGMYLYPLQTLSSHAMQHYIAEWASPNFHQSAYFPVLALMLATLVGLGLSPRRIRPRDLLLLLVMTAAVLRSARHIPIYALVAAPMLSRLVPALGSGPAPLLDSSRSRAFAGKMLLNLGLVAALAIFVVARVSFVIRNQDAEEGSHFPKGAIAYLETQHPSGPILNHYNWGGYFIWKLYPDYPVYIDGRADLYGDAFMDEFAATYYLRPHWQDPLDRWQIRTVILPPAAPLVAALRGQPAWKQVYGDAQAVVLTRGRYP